MSVWYMSVTSTLYVLRLQVYILFDSFITEVPIIQKLGLDMIGASVMKEFKVNQKLNVKCKLQWLYYALFKTSFQSKFYRLIQCFSSYLHLIRCYSFISYFSYNHKVLASADSHQRCSQDPHKDLGWRALELANGFQSFTIQKQLFRGALRKRCSENMQQIHKRTLMPKCDFNKVATLLKSHFGIDVLL